MTKGAIQGDTTNIWGWSCPKTPPWNRYWSWVMRSAIYDVAFMLYCLWYYVFGWIFPRDAHEGQTGTCLPGTAKCDRQSKPSTFLTLNAVSCPEPNTSWEFRSHLSKKIDDTFANVG